MMVGRSRIIAIVGIALLPALGCLKGDTGLPPGETGTVSGKITFNGNPVTEGASVTMLHDETGQIAMGVIQSDGTFQLMMKGGSDILVGKYNVAVTPPGGDESEPVASDDPEALKEQYLSAGEPAKAPVEKWPDIPKKYRVAETSGLTFEVKTGDNEFNKDLAK